MPPKPRKKRPQGAAPAPAAAAAAEPAAIEATVNLAEEGVLKDLAAGGGAETTLRFLLVCKD